MSFTPKEFIEEKCKRNGLVECSICGGLYLRKDLKKHVDWHHKTVTEKERVARRSEWKRTKNPLIECLLQSSVPFLVKQIRTNEVLQEGGFDHWLYENFVFRKRNIT